MDTGSLLFYRADGVLVVRPVTGKSHVANVAERAEANAAVSAACTVSCEDARE